VAVPRRRPRHDPGRHAGVTAADAAKVPVGQAIFDKELLKKAVPKKTRELERFAELIESLRSPLPEFSIADLLVAVMEESGYLRELRNLPAEELLEQRYQKFRRMGVFLDGAGGSNQLAEERTGRAT